MRRVKIIIIKCCRINGWKSPVKLECKAEVKFQTECQRCSTKHQSALVEIRIQQNSTGIQFSKSPFCLHIAHFSHIHISFQDVLPTFQHVFKPRTTTLTPIWPWIPFNKNFAFRCFMRENVWNSWPKQSCSTLCHCVTNGSPQEPLGVPRPHENHWFKGCYWMLLCKLLTYLRKYWGFSVKRLCLNAEKSLIWTFKPKSRD